MQISRFISTTSKNGLAIQQNIQLFTAVIKVILRWLLLPLKNWETLNCPHTPHIPPFNGPLSGTTRVSRYQKGKTNLDFTVARDSEWQWHQLRHMQVCTSLQADNHASTPPLSFLQAGCPPATQPTVSKHWRQQTLNCPYIYTAMADSNRPIWIRKNKLETTWNE